jgi:hypothetical protein
VRLLVSGATATLSTLLPAHADRLGMLLVPGAGNAPLSIPDGLPWACDNGCFVGLDPARFLALLAKIVGKPGLLWVTVPDVVGDAAETLRRFYVWEPVLAGPVGLPLAYVAQDGAEQLDLPWGRMRALFVGGSTAWKESKAAADLIGEAKRRGRWVHVGRVNTRRRLEMALAWGADSVDGSGFSRWPAIRIPLALRWLEELAAKKAA